MRRQPPLNIAVHQCLSSGLWPKSARLPLESNGCSSMVELGWGGLDDDEPDVEDPDVGYMPWMGPLSVSLTRMLACDCLLSTVLIARDRG